MLRCVAVRRRPKKRKGETNQVSPFSSALRFRRRTGLRDRLLARRVPEDEPRDAAIDDRGAHAVVGRKPKRVLTGRIGDGGHAHLRGTHDLARMVHGDALALQQTERRQRDGNNHIGHAILLGATAPATGRVAIDRRHGAPGTMGLFTLDDSEAGSSLEIGQYGLGSWTGKEVLSYSRARRQEICNRCLPGWWLRSSYPAAHTIRYHPK